MQISSITGLPLPPPAAIINMPLPMSYEQFRKDHPAQKIEVVDDDAVHNLSWPQYYFVTSKARFPAMIAGYGAGKTEAGVVRALRLKLDQPDLNVGYYLPTFDLIKQIVFPRMEALLQAHGCAYFLNETSKELTIYGMKGRIIFRTMDRPESIIGYEHADAVVDELDVLKTDKAADVWRKIVARNRQKKPDGSRNTIGVVTTPEGFRFVYQKWKQKPLKGSQIIKASTYSNQANLPDDYIDTLRDNFPDQMLEAYLMGEFVNLTTGSVYRDFDRQLNDSPEIVQADDSLHVGIDFNVGQMAAVVHVMRDKEPIAVDELVNYYDTPAMIKALKERYQSGDNKHTIIVYPDASGDSRATVNASQSDIALLRQAGFIVMANKKNPFIKDRVAAFNKMIHKDGKRRYKVNTDKCPHLTESLEKQAYDKNGVPDKASGLDHIVDAAGYFISYRYPILHGKAIQTKLKGV